MFIRGALRQHFLFLGSTFSWEGLNVAESFFWPKDDLVQHLPELRSFIHNWHSGKCVPLLVCGWPGRSCWTRAKQLLPRGNKTAKQNLNQPPSQTDLLSSLSCICVCSMNIVHPQFKFLSCSNFYLTFD